MTVAGSSLVVSFGLSASENLVQAELSQGLEDASEIGLVRKPVVFSISRKGLHNLVLVAA